MKYIIVCLFFIFSGLFLRAQPPSEQLANRISRRMQDSLLLTDAQKQDIYWINLQLHSRKAAVWQQYSDADSLLRVNLQRIENSRDSLYKPLLSGQQFELYLQKKNRLINNN